MIGNPGRLLKKCADDGKERRGYQREFGGWVTSISPSDQFRAKTLSPFLRIEWDRILHVRTFLLLLDVTGAEFTLGVFCVVRWATEYEFIDWRTIEIAEAGFMNFRTLKQVSISYNAIDEMTFSASSDFLKHLFGQEARGRMPLGGTPYFVRWQNSYDRESRFRAIVGNLRQCVTVSKWKKVYEFFFLNNVDYASRCAAKVFNGKREFHRTESFPLAEYPSPLGINERLSVQQRSFGSCLSVIGLSSNKPQRPQGSDGAAQANNDERPSSPSSVPPRRFMWRLFSLIGGTIFLFVGGALIVKDKNRFRGG